MILWSHEGTDLRQSQIAECMGQRAFDQFRCQTSTPVGGVDEVRNLDSPMRCLRVPIEATPADDTTVGSEDDGPWGVTVFDEAVRVGLHVLRRRIAIRRAIGELHCAVIALNREERIDIRAVGGSEQQLSRSACRGSHVVTLPNAALQPRAERAARGPSAGSAGWALLCNRRTR